VSPIFLLGSGVALPGSRVSIRDVFDAERARTDRQLAALSPRLAARVITELGIDAVLRHGGPPSDLGLRAARAALDRARVTSDRVRLVIDFSTLPGDHPGVWSLALRVQGELAPDALALSVGGNGCAGFHVALRTASALMRVNPEIDIALLVAADCVRDYGRVCLPVSVLGDGSSAVVLGREAQDAPRLLGLSTSTVGAFADVLTLRGDPPKTEVNGTAFESQVLPAHFVMCQRVLSRAMAQIPAGEVASLVYPNTSDLDRHSAARALGLPLVGSGLRDQGHVFASDMILNLPDRIDRPTALVAVGSGFTWGACVFG
jgi:3-oxoacyl-[acyl-carrier-protein] synthase III